MAPHRVTAQRKAANGDLVVFLHGDLFHRPCWRELSTTVRRGESAVLNRRSRELIEKSAEAGGSQLATALALSRPGGGASPPTRSAGASLARRRAVEGQALGHGCQGLRDLLDEE